MSTESVSSLKRLQIQILDNAVTVGALLFWALVLYWSHTQALPRAQYGILFLGGVLVLYMINEATDSIDEGDYSDLVVLTACLAVIVVVSYYLFTNFDTVYVRRQGWALEHEYVLAWLMITVILYLTWRSYGNIFLALVGGAMLYSLYGNYVPGILGHAGVPNEVMLQVLITDLRGFYGSLTQLAAAWIAPFLLYAGLLFGFGAFDLILRLAIVSGKYIESGVAQTAVIASAIIGSINGSYAANAGMTGSFTIPTMMDSGIRGRTAAGIEAVASTSGQVLPPVMGASAFVMASFLGIAYVDVLVAGLIPAAILIASIVIAVHYTASNEISGASIDFNDYFEERLTTAEKIVEGVRFGVPFVVLITTLGVLQWTIMTAALYTVVTMIVLGIVTPVLQTVYFVSKGSEPSHVELDDRWSSGVRSAVRPVRRNRVVDSFLAEVANTVKGFRRGAVILAPIGIILAAVNGVVDLFMITGVPSKLALMLMELSGGVMILAVLLAMLICIIMGVGMPTVAAYVIVSLLVAPALIHEFGVPHLAAHYMVFYAAVMAGITPPVAIAAVITSGIAEADFWETCGTAITIAAPLFVLPISFVYHPTIVSTAIGPASMVAGGLVLFGAITMIYGLNYPFQLKRRYTLPIRFGLFWLGVFVMVFPNHVAQAAGVAVFLAVFLGEKAATSGIPFASVPSRD